MRRIVCDSTANMTLDDEIAELYRRTVAPKLTKLTRSHINYFRHMWRDLRRGMDKEAHGFIEALVTEQIISPDDAKIVSKYIGSPYIGWN